MRLLVQRPGVFATETLGSIEDRERDLSAAPLDWGQRRKDQSCANTERREETATVVHPAASRKPVLSFRRLGNRFYLRVSRVPRNFEFVHGYQIAKCAMPLLVAHTPLHDRLRSLRLKLWLRQLRVFFSFFFFFQSIERSTLAFITNFNGHVYCTKHESSKPR